LLLEHANDLVGYRAPIASSAVNSPKSSNTVFNPLGGTTAVGIEWICHFGTKAFVLGLARTIAGTPLGTIFSVERHSLSD
jgi:hypothetical protein